MKTGFLGVLLLSALVPTAGMAASDASPDILEAAVRGSGDQGIIGAYRNRGNQPLWSRDGTILPAAARLTAILRRAPLDGMETGPALANEIDVAIAGAASRRPEDMARAELLMSKAWVGYVQRLRRPVDVGMIYADASLSPEPAFAASILSAAAAAPDLSSHLDAVSNLNPVYSRLRDGLAALRAKTAEALPPGRTSAQAEEQLKVNLDRARLLPSDRTGRFVLVDAASARLWMYENGVVRDTMRVIVGKSAEQSPMVAGLLRDVVLNPYWNVPPDLVQKRVAPGAAKEGAAFLRSRNYELLSDWTPNATLLDAASVNWAAVTAGKQELRVRQLPGPANAMGKMKFTFPNEFGVYLHDTPDKSLFAKTDRKLSSGCIRLEDAGRLARWLFGTMPVTASSRPEQAVAIPRAVPVYITYLTAEWSGSKLALNADSYRRDTALASRLVQPVTTMPEARLVK